MELISFYVPYKFKKGHPKFAGLELLLENFKRQAADLKKYVDSETERICKEIEAGQKALKDSVEWVYSLAEQVSTVDPVEYRRFSIEMHPYINGVLVIDPEILNLIGLRDNRTCRKSAWFSIINNVMIVYPSISYWEFASIKNGRVLSETETSRIMMGVLPDLLKGY